VGLFKEWDCSIEHCQLFPGDALAIYTDGVTESFNAAGEEFGEKNLIEALRRYSHHSPQTLVASILSDIRQFSVHEQYDDITLLIAKCR
jgi:serine phosphatase RsbU (regulator of sigma subunit)